MDAAAVSYASRFADALAAGIAPSVDALVGAVACVLLIACANTSSLFLNRLLGRRKDVAIRMAIGGSRARIVRQFVIESMIFTAAATVVAVAAAAFSLTYLSTLSSTLLPAPVQFVMSVRVLAWTVAVALGVALVTGLVPAIQASRPDVVEHLKDGARGSSSGSGAKLRQALVIAEVALSTVLLAGATLLLLTFLRLQRAPLGFDTKGVATAVLGLPAAKYPTPQQQSDFYDRMLERLRADQTITAAAVSLGAPIAGATRFPYAVGGRPVPPMAERAVAVGNIVSPEYFKVFGLGLVAGRLFTNDDRANTPFVCVLNQSLAKRLFGAKSALGESILLGRDASLSFRVVGVIADLHSNGANNPVPDELYLPLRQRPGPSMFLVARTQSDPATLQAAMQRALNAVDPEQAPVVFRHDGRDARVVARDPEPRGEADAGLCGPRARACHHRPLFGAGVHRLAAQAGNRHAHRAGRLLARRRPPADGIRAAARRHRDRHRRGGGGLDRTPDPAAALRRGRVEPHGLPCGRGDLRRDCGRGVPAAVAAGGAHRSARHAALRVVVTRPTLTATESTARTRTSRP